MLHADAQLDGAIALLRALYTRNYPNIYAALDSPTWTPIVAPLRDLLRCDFRKATFELLGRAYNTIAPARAAHYLGLDAAADHDALVAGLVAEGWAYDAGEGVLRPAVARVEASQAGGKDERIARLTALVTHLTEV